MSKSNNGFGRRDIRAFFRDTLYGEEPDAPKLRSKSAVSRRRNLTESIEDYSLPPLQDDESNRLAQAIVTGINLEFDINASGPDLVELEEQIQYHMAKHPGLPEILFDLAMEAMLEHGGDSGMRDQKGYVVTTDDDDDGMAPLDVSGSDRAEMVDMVASVVYDAMDSSSFSSDALRDLIDDMSDKGQIDREMWLSSNIDDEEIRDRVIEIEDENADFTGL